MGMAISFYRFVIVLVNCALSVQIMRSVFLMPDGSAHLLAYPLLRKRPGRKLPLFDCQWQCRYRYTEVLGLSWFSFKEKFVGPGVIGIINFHRETIVRPGLGGLWRMLYQSACRHRFSRRDVYAEKLLTTTSPSVRFKADYEEKNVMRINEQIHSLEMRAERFLSQLELDLRIAALIGVFGDGADKKHSRVLLTSYHLAHKEFYNEFFADLAELKKQADLYDGYEQIAMQIEALEEIFRSLETVHWSEFTTLVDLQYMRSAIKMGFNGIKMLETAMNQSNREA